MIWTPEAHRFPSPLRQLQLGRRRGLRHRGRHRHPGLSLVIMVSLWLFLTRTWSGRALRAMSQDLDAARQMGVPTDRLRQLAFGLGAALAAVAGVMVAMYYQNLYPQMGMPFGLKGFTAALLGGLASIPGAVVGGLLLGVLEALAVGYVGEGFRDMVAFGLLLVILTVRPQGLLGDRRLEALGGSRGASGIMPSTSIVIGQGGQPLCRATPFDLPYAWLAAGVALLALLPFLGVSDYVVQVGLMVLIFALLSVGLTMLSGAAGIMFLGFAGFFGVGAYVAALSAKLWAAAGRSRASFSRQSRPRMPGRHDRLPLRFADGPCGRPRDARHRRADLAGPSELDRCHRRPERRLRHSPAAAPAAARGCR